MNLRQMRQGAHICAIPDFECLPKEYSGKCAKARISAPIPVFECLPGEYPGKCAKARISAPAPVFECLPGEYSAKCAKARISAPIPVFECLPEEYPGKCAKARVYAPAPFLRFFREKTRPAPAGFAGSLVAPPQDTAKAHKSSRRNPDLRAVSQPHLKTRPNPTLLARPSPDLRTVSRSPRTPAQSPGNSFHFADNISIPASNPKV
jgi:hypothetical protein